MAITLNKRFKMPTVGLGVWRMEGKEIRDLIINAINIGYCHFDCAADYKNEAEVGEALAEAFLTGLVKREDLFITTKASLTFNQEFSFSTQVVVTQELKQNRTFNLEE